MNEPAVTSRQRNKSLGRTCGNCSAARGTTDGRWVYCAHPNVCKQGQNQMNWYRKSKGGCAFWSSETHNEENGERRRNEPS